jgi:NAD(P)-dependent dehydrogenase (short-subunit alcohol dehydrogenase family)
LYWFAPFLLAREVARLCMTLARRGRILNMSSVGGLFDNRPDPGMASASYPSYIPGVLAPGSEEATRMSRAEEPRTLRLGAKLEF